ncbi:MAG TPA: hypothetical protein VIF82_06440 [Burkholderiaceae bacterium]|jgi:hypothetical protein
MEFIVNNPCKFFILTIALFAAQYCHAAEELITTAQYKNGDTVPYILNYQNLHPKYVIILFPGGNGNMDPRMEDGKLVYGFKGNFVIRTRKFIIDDEFATVATNSTQSPERIQAVLDDLKNRFPAAKIYLMGTSKGTHDTMALAGYLSDKIAGEIHTSSMPAISSFNAKRYNNRQLVVHHKNDSCFATGYSNAEASHNKYGNELITMDGGISVGDPCEPFAHHGYNGIEKETIDAIKNWIKQGDERS